MSDLQTKNLSQLKKGVRNVVVTARVISKGSIKYGFQDNSFKIEIYDGTLDFSTLVYFSLIDCEKYFDIIEVGKIYKFARGYVISDAQKKSTRNCLKYDTFSPQYITPIEDELIEQNTINFNKFELVKINKISDIHSTYHFDVLGVVMEEPSKEKSKDRDGRELETMRFLIGDETKHTIQVSIRNEFGLNLNLKIFDVILIKTTHVNVYLNQKSIDSGSGILVNPDIQEALDLLTAFEKIILEDDEVFVPQENVLENILGDDKEEQKDSESRLKLSSKTNNKEFTQIGDNKISMHFYDQVEDQLERVIRLSLTLPPTDPVFQKEFSKCIYSEIEGEIYSGSLEKKPYYLACSVCQKKIEHCTKKCQGSIPIARMTTNLNIADATGAVSALAFNDQCIDIFGFDAEFLRTLDEAQKQGKYHRKDPTCRDFIRVSFTQKYRFRILSGVQIYEKKYQPKHSIIGCSKINTIQDIQETAKSIELHLQKRNI